MGKGSPLNSANPKKEKKRTPPGFFLSWRLHWASLRPKSRGSAERLERLDSAFSLSAAEAGEAAAPEVHPAPGGAGPRGLRRRSGRFFSLLAGCSVPGVFLHAAGRRSWLFSYNAKMAKRSLEGSTFRSVLRETKGKTSIQCFMLKGATICLALPSPFFPGILLSRKPPETQRKQLVFEKNDD